MLHSYLFAPFADAIRQQLYERVRTALNTDPTVSLLLGNFAVDEGGETLDAVVIRPHSITLLVFVTGGGRLNIPSLGFGAWKLDGQPLRGASAGADNPYEQFRRQKDALASWLRPQLGPEQANLQFISGVVVFAAPISFGPEVEEQLSQHPDSSFQLLTDAAQLPRRLRQLSRPEIELSDADINQWARDLADEPAPTSASAAAAAPAALPPDADEPVEATNRSLWRRALGWLGAEDITDDTPYGSYGSPAAQVAASSAEKQRLEQLRQEAQAELRQQLQNLESREAERERSMAELRTQLAQAPPVTSEAQALREKLAAENQEKIALEEAIRASRAESEARNRELDAKINQLGSLIEQLHARSAAPESVAPAPPSAMVPAPVAPTAAPSAPASAPAPKPVAPVPPVPAIPTPTPAAAAPTSVSKPAAAPVSVALPAAAPVAPEPRAASAAATSKPSVGVSQPTTAEPQTAKGATRASWHLENVPAALQTAYKRAWGWQQRMPRPALIAVGVGLLSLAIWGIARLGSGAPEPYQENGKWGFADGSGKPVIPARYSSVAPFQDERAVVEDDGVFGLIDEQGKEVVPIAYDALNPYAGGYARVRVGDAYTFLDEQGEEFSAYYFNALDFSEGLAAVLDHRGWFYISGPEEPAETPIIFREAYSFRDGLARVRTADGYTFIKQKYLKDPSIGTKPFGFYQLATDFENGKARVTQNGRSFTIDTDGDEVN